MHLRHIVHTGRLESAMAVASENRRKQIDNRRINAKQDGTQEAFSK